MTIAFCDEEYTIWVKVKDKLEFEQILSRIKNNKHLTTFLL